MNKILTYIKTLSDNKEVQDILIKNLWKILLSQEDMKLFTKENEKKLTNIKNWIYSIVKNKELFITPKNLTIDNLDNIANKYFEKKNNNSKIITLDEKNEKFITNLNNYYLVQLLTSESLEIESKIMQHGLENKFYTQRLEENNYKYFSIRDEFNKPHLTFVIYKNEVNSLYGKQNKIETKYIDLLIPWFKEYNYFFRSLSYMLILNDNDQKLYNINNIPENCKIDGDLDLHGYLIEKLPNNLTVNGSLNLKKCRKLNKIPDNLIVNGNLNLTETNITELPNNIIIKNNLKLTNSSIIKLPENLTIDGLNINNCPYLKKIPENLNVKFSLNISFSKIKKIPDNIECERIFIDKKQINLINKNTKCKEIFIGKDKYTKEEFIEKFKNSQKLKLTKF